LLPYFFDHRHLSLPLPSSQHTALVEALLTQDQAHLFQTWPPLGTSDNDKLRSLSQLKSLDTSYPGGLVQYIRNARKLLEDSRTGANPFEGCIPSVPQGEKLDFGSQAFQDFENAGVEAAADAAFVLVAGGLGERLGYHGIKVALPLESASGTCFLQHYVESILALQNKAAEDKKKRVLPLVIMTSDDTHDRTVALLTDHNYFGASPDQITLLKQEKVACIQDNDAHLALDPKDSYLIQTKPHGHGDVHMLLHTSGVAQQWAAQGLKWVCFFQDTNGLVFRGLPAALGVSATHQYDINSLAVPRRAGEAIGAITTLTSPSTGTSITINVEYNQLDPLLRATINPDGDVNDPETGYSPLPGNINQLVVSIPAYVKELERSRGVISEFVNPKYADASCSTFKSSTRLECMMQDLPKGMPSSTTRVGFTVVNQVWAAYSPVKNSPTDAAAKAAAGIPSHSATTGELDVYHVNCNMLKIIGVEVASPSPAPEFNGLKSLEMWPRVCWSPLWAATFQDLKDKIPPTHTSSRGLEIGKDSVLVIKAKDAVIKGLKVGDGAAAVIMESKPVQQSGEDELDGGGVLEVSNEGWKWVPLTGEDDEDAPEEMRIRGFKVVKSETLFI
jgi:UDP-sugar pyrophosphorylase